MKINLKRTICMLLTVSMLLSLCIPSSALATQAAEKEPVFLLLGDSIASGFGISNPEEACYGRIVADTNHYAYRNLAVMGTDSTELMDAIETGTVQNPATGEEITWKDCIRAADIICLSVGANDFFERPDFTQILVGAISGKTDLLDETAALYSGNLRSILDTVYALNPDAAVIVQTYYCSCRGLAKRVNLAVTDRINAAIEQFDKEHPGRIHICDISPAMTGKPENLADDCLHPNAKGNVAIAEILLKTLRDLGLGSETTPVVKVPGQDRNRYMEMYETRAEGVRFTIIMMLLTGNGVNILRLIRNTYFKK